MNKTLLAIRTLKLVNGYWDKLMIEKYGEVKHIYDIPEKDYNKMYKKVCRKIAKPACRLRRIGSWRFCRNVLGDKMEQDTLFALTEDLEKEK